MVGIGEFTCVCSYITTSTGGWVGGWLGGWVVGLVGNKANLSPSSVGARVGAELGNMNVRRVGKCSRQNSI